LTLMYESSPDLPRYITTDEKKLRQVFINLLSNAVKFTQHGGINLRGRLSEIISEDKVRLTFELEDTGPGISPDQIKDLFDYFVQTEAGKKSLEGTGLGLAICKNFVQMMEGDIRVTSEINKGSIFIFDILVKLSSSTEITTKPKERKVIDLEPGTRIWRILITEDREANRKLLVKLLQPYFSVDGKFGFEVREAVNGKKAIEIWEEWSPDLIFMDMRMPEMNGHQATQIIRSREQGHKTKIVALTASAFEEERQLILSEGIDDFIRKPFKENDIFDVLSKHLEGIHFIYNEDINSLPASPQVLIASSAQQVDFKQLPADWLADLKFATAAADSQKIHDLLEKIRHKFPGEAQKIESLATQYRFDLIINLLEV
jgi:CheY-like chemotaxis protein